jgi:hypothetical protein
MDDIFIGGVPFIALGHRDGRFVRAPGLFAFARREADGLYRVLHLEMAGQINLAADAGHPRWSWALGQGMDSLLIHLFGRRARLPPDAPPGLETVLWHEGAEVGFLSLAEGAGGSEDEADALAAEEAALWREAYGA